MEAPHLTTTADRQRGTITFEGRSETSKQWSGGAAYAIRCGRCGLEPGRVGFVSKCLCTCTRCFEPLNGKKVCPSRFCGHHQPVEGSGVDDGRPRSPETLPIATVHVKAKRKRAVDAVVVVSDDDDDVVVAAAAPAGAPVASGVVAVSDDEADAVVAALADSEDDSVHIPKCFSLPSAPLS